MSPSIGPDQLAAERKVLLLYAMVRLRDPDLAQDAVQETLAAALSALAGFQRHSSLRTWLISILRNKISDLLQTRSRLVSADRADAEAEGDDIESVFDTHGMWHEDARPQRWGDPERALEQQQFWVVFEACLSRMPARIAEVFTLREVLDEPIEAICKNLAITPTNCSVMLYRARMRLRACLEQNWFASARRE